ncbi:SbcD DNA repair exonuclease [Burkholderiales bacterium]
MRARFLHTSDWQLGVTRQFLSADTQARWAEARFEGIRNLGRIAKEELCEFIVVAGDVFESNQVDRKTILKACDAMASIEIPIYLLPANHDPLDAASVFSSKPWRDRKPANAHVLDAMGKIYEVRPGIEVVGAPWTSKRPLTDLVSTAADALEATAGVIRIMVGHGAVDQLSPDKDNPALIRVSDAEEALLEGRYQYLALGDRHSLTSIGTSGRIYYSGTHEAYDFGEVDPGKVLIVEIGPDTVNATPRQNGAWRFAVHEAHVSTSEDVEALSRHLDASQEKERTILKLGLRGTLDILSHARLEEVEEHASELFAAIVRSDSRSELSIMPAGEDFESLNLAGFAASSVEKLRAQARGAGSERDRAADALALLVRLVGRAA